MKERSFSRTDGGAAGLTPEQVLASRRRYGANVLTRRKRKGFFRQFLANFGDPIIKILLAALAVNLIFLFRTSDWTESVGIAAAVLIATLVSTLSQYGSESAFLELQKASANALCRVKRADGIREIPVSELVVGDLVLLEAGEKIPADGVLLSGKLSVDQSALNGESAETEKIPVFSGGEWDLSHKDQLFCGSIVSAGDGIMRVGRVGDKTFYGGLAGEMQEEPPESPLRVKLAGLAGTLSRLGYLAAILIAVADLFNSFLIDNGMNFAAAWSDFCTWKVCLPRLLHALTLAIAIVVVAVPEGLPMMIAVVLSSNMLRMIKDKVMVRKPVGIEASGGLNILFTDKTGTLTKGELEAVRFVEGDGQVCADVRECSPTVGELLRLSACFNTACVLSSSGVMGGNATDRALMKSILPLDFRVENYERLTALPFDSAYKFSAASVRGADGRMPLFGEKCTFVKGAPEKILPFCTEFVDANGELHSFDGEAAGRKQRAMTERAMRVLAVAVSRKEVNGEKDLRELTFVALIGIRDDLRKEVPAAIREVTDAGIQVVMITGDNIETAKAVAEEAGLMTPTPEGEAPLAVTGKELSAMTDAQVTALLPRLRVVARALPTDKSRLVRLAQASGMVTGMTGDGINDAAALKKADVGFAMGTGTDVAKEAGDIVILDNNFASIARAIRYGRTIFKSIRKFVVFQLTMNLCAVGVSLVAPFLGFDTPVTVIQMLWINIIMDTLAGLAFAGEPALPEYMEETPIRRGEPVLNRQMAARILFMGLYTVGLCLLFLKAPVFRRLFRWEENPVYFYTAFFALFVFSGIFNAFNARTERLNLFSHLGKNKLFVVFILLVMAVQLLLIYFGGEAFRCAGLTAKELALTLLLACTVIPADFLRKVLVKKFAGASARKTTAGRELRRKKSAGPCAPAVNRSQS